eukprot:127095_1
MFIDTHSQQTSCRCNGKIQRGLTHALHGLYLVNQLYRDNGSKLRSIRKQNKEQSKDKEQRTKVCKSEELACDVMSSRRPIKPSICTLMERSQNTNTSKKQKRSRFKSNQFVEVNMDQLLREPVSIFNTQKTTY